jgi:hypothetical protein
VNTVELHAQGSWLEATRHSMGPMQGVSSTAGQQQQQQQQQQLLLQQQECLIYKRVLMEQATQHNL